MKNYTIQISQKVKYDSESINKFVRKESAGVYVIYHDDDVIYVGRSKDMADRLHEHQADTGNPILYSILNDDEKHTHYKVIYEVDGDEQSRIENILYDFFYQPHCNLQRPKRFRKKVKDFI